MRARLKFTVYEVADIAVLFLMPGCIVVAIVASYNLFKSFSTNF